MRLKKETSKYLVMTLLLLLISLMPLFSETIEQKAERYAKEVAILQLEKNDLQLKVREKDIDIKGKELIIETKEDIIKEKNGELFWARVTNIVVLVAIIIGGL